MTLSLLFAATYANKIHIYGKIRENFFRDIVPIGDQFLIFQRLIDP